MISAKVNVARPIILNMVGGKSGETWELTRVQTLTGELAGTDASGTALDFPLELEQVEGLNTWVSSPVLFTAAGQYIAVFTSGSGQVHTDVIDAVAIYTYTAGVNTSSTSAYASVLDMVNRYGAEHLAQLGDQSVPRVVSAEMLSTALAEGDMSVYSEEEQAATDSAISLILLSLQDATTLIEGHLRPRYALPLESVPATVVRWTCEIARHTLHHQGAPDFVVKAADQALAQLERVSTGKLDLGLTSNQEPVPAASETIVLKGADRVFSPAALVDF